MTGGSISRSAHYVDWSVEHDLFCTLNGKTKSYCTPESYKGKSLSLYRNLGDGTFQDITAAAGLEDASSKALGLALLDHNGDGWVDLFVANDTQPNRLYENRQGHFVDIGVPSGVAFNESGVARAGMGVDAADYDGSGRPEPGDRELLERDDGALHERRERAVHRRSAARDDWPGLAPEPHVRRVLLRLRSRRQARHLRRQRPRGRRHRVGAVARHLRAGAAPVPQSGVAEIRRRQPSRQARR